MSSFSVGFYRFQISSEYKAIHAWIYLFSTCFTIALFVAINSLQGFVLKQILSIPTNQLGNYTGSLTFYDELMVLSTISLWGILSDRIGRFPTFAAGFFIESIGLGFFPFMERYSPDLILCRLVFAAGGAMASMTITGLLADLCGSQDGDRGKLSALSGFFSGVGAIFAVSVLLPLPSRFADAIAGLRVTFLLCSALCLVMCILIVSVFFAISPLSIPASASNHSSQIIVEQSESQSSLSPSTDEPTPLVSPLNTLHTPSSFIESLKKSAIDGIVATKDPSVLLGVMASFLARSDSVSLTLFLPIWVLKHYISIGECIDTGAGDVIKDSCREAYVQASILSGVTQTFALVAAPFIGVLLDRYKREWICLSAGASAAVGYILLSLQSNPLSRLNFLFLFFIGVGEIGLIISSMTLVTKATIPTHSRGTVAGISSFVGAVGVLVTTKGGGLLFDISPTLPLLLLGILHASFLVLGSVGLYILRKS